MTLADVEFTGPYIFHQTSLWKNNKAISKNTWVQSRNSVAEVAYETGGQEEQPFKCPECTQYLYDYISIIFVHYGYEEPLLNKWKVIGMVFDNNRNVFMVTAIL